VVGKQEVTQIITTDGRIGFNQGQHMRMRTRFSVELRHVHAYGLPAGIDNLPARWQVWVVRRQGLRYELVLWYNSRRCRY